VSNSKLELLIYLLRFPANLWGFKKEQGLNPHSLDLKDAINETNSSSDNDILPLHSSLIMISVKLFLDFLKII